MSNIVKTNLNKLIDNRYSTTEPFAPKTAAAISKELDKRIERVGMRRERGCMGFTSGATVALLGAIGGGLPLIGIGLLAVGLGVDDLIKNLNKESQFEARKLMLEILQRHPQA